jgi:hypothetical protein
MTRRLSLAATLLALAALAAATLTPALGSGAAPQQLTMTVGDSVLVDGAGIACQVTRRSGRVVIECGRTGDPAGTYMTILGKRTAKVARVRSADVAKVILTARHGAGWRTCGESARAARAGARGCR